MAEPIPERPTPTLAEELQQLRTLTVTNGLLSTTAFMLMLNLALDAETDYASIYSIALLAALLIWAPCLNLRSRLMKLGTSHHG